MNASPARLQPSAQLWRPLVVLLVLLSSLVLARGATFLHVGLLLAIVALPLLQRHPPLGLIALIVANLYLPFAIGTGTQTELNASVLLLTVLALLWWLQMVARRQLDLVRSRPIAPLLAFASVAIVATVSGSQSWLVFAQTASPAAQIGGLAIFLFSAAAFLLTAHQIRTTGWLAALTYVFLLSGGLFILGRVVPALHPVSARVFQPGATGSVFWIWVVALAVGQATYNYELRRLWRLALAGLALATLYTALVRDGWLSGWLPPLIAATVALAVGFPRLGVGFGLTGSVLLVLNSQRIAERLLGGDNAYSLTTRLEAWRIVAEIVKVNPLLGLGPANYYRYTPLFPIFGYAVSFNSHNNYVDIVAQTGLLGLACFLWFMLEVARLGWRLRTRVTDGFARGYVNGALGGLVGMLVAGMLGDWVLPFVYNIGLSGFRASVLGWVFLGGLVALEQLATRGDLASRDADSVENSAPA